MFIIVGFLVIVTSSQFANDVPFRPLQYIPISFLNVYSTYKSD